MAVRLGITAVPDVGRITLGSRFAGWRRLDSPDVGSIIAHLAALGEADRRLRYGGATTLESLAERYRHVDYGVNTLSGHFVDGRLAALLELYPDAHGAGIELALTASPGQRDAGAKTALMQLAIAHGHAMSGAAIRFECLASDSFMLWLGELHGFRIAIRDGAARGVLGAGRRPAPGLAA